MEYAKLLERSAGKFDYRESPLKTVMKVNELKKTIDKDGRANIIRQEPYANKIATYLSNEELKSKMNLGAIAYKQGIQSVYDNYQLEKLKNDPIKYVEKARKQAELMKIFSNPSQLEYLKKTDPIGLFYLEQSQDEEKQRDLVEKEIHRQQELQRQQQEQEEAIQRQQEARQQQEEIRLRTLREATLRPIDDYENHLKGPKVTFNGQSAVINGQIESNKNYVVSILNKFDPTLNAGMTLKQIVTQYNRNRLQRASELSGIPIKQIQRNIERQKNEELVRSRMNQGELDTAEGPFLGSLFDEEQPIAQQHAEELMAENPDLDANEAVREAHDNVVEARPIAQQLEAQEQYQKESSIPLRSSWIAEGEDVPSTGPLKELELVPSSKILNKITTKDTLVKIATKFKVPYNDTDSVDIIRQRLKDWRKLQKRMETFGAKRIEGAVPEVAEEVVAPSSPKQEFVEFRSLPLDTQINELIDVYSIERQLRYLNDDEDMTREQKQTIRNELYEKRRNLEEQFKQKYNTSILGELRNNILKVESEYYKRQAEEEEPAQAEEEEEPAQAEPSQAKGPELTMEQAKALDIQDIYALFKKYKLTPSKLKLYKTEKGKRKTKPLTEVSKEQLINILYNKGIVGQGFSGKGFRPLSSYPPHIIAGSLHIVKQRKKNRLNQNEYNREQAHYLTQNAIHGEGFFW